MARRTKLDRRGLQWALEALVCKNTTGLVTGPGR